MSSATRHEALAWVRDALASSTLVDHLAHYLLDKQAIHATDGRMVVSHPFPWTGTALVNGAAFEKVMGKMPPLVDIRATDTHLVLTAGKFRGQVKTMDPTAWVYTRPEGKWSKLPPGLVDALLRLRPFVSENATQPWATCIAHLGGSLYATNNIVLVRSDAPTLPEGVRFPVWVVDFLAARTEGLVEWMASDTMLAFRWKNGAWMRSPTIVADFPTACGEIINKSRTKKLVKITQEWRKALDRIASLTESEVRLSPTSMVGTMDVLEVEDGAGTPTPKGTEFTAWDHRYLLPVAAVAQGWNPLAWPQPAYFSGHHIEGVLIGRRGA